MITHINASQRSKIVIAGGIAMIGALVVGIGEFLFQFSPRGGYEGTDYLYFLDVSDNRLTWGHFIGVLAAPLYLVGYWHIAEMLKPAGKKIAAAVFGLGVYAFMIGDVWLGGRVNLALTVKAREAADAAIKGQFSGLLDGISSHNEPLINIVRVLVLIISILMAIGILRGKSFYPRWIVLFSPIVMLALIFGLYALAPTVGVYVLPVAMNVSHLVFFALSIWVALRISVNKDA